MNYDYFLDEGKKEEAFESPFRSGDGNASRKLNRAFINA